MSLARRLDALDASLTPTQLVLRWLAEAHAYGSLEAYVASILDLPGDQQPIDRLCREAHDGAWTRLHGRPADQVQRAVHSALRETVFRYELVLRIYETAHGLLDQEALIDAALSAHIGLLTAEGRAERRHDPTYTETFTIYRDLLTMRVGELHAAQRARSTVEERYLDGHAALFPDVAASWDEQLKRTQLLADMAVRLAELDGVPPAMPGDPEALSRRTTQLVADLVEPAKSEALEKLGEGQRALGIAKGWVRAKLGVAPMPVPDPPTLRGN
ncbi:MAG: hypothetical protein ABSG37_11535 [Candidatus Limnocylindrales bacterium]|jgi:hypothetical protein